MSSAYSIRVAEPGQLAGTSQVKGYIGDGSIWSDVAWRREI
jgi:hypothetical protein